MPVYKVISKFRRKSYPFSISELKSAITTHDGDGNKNVKKAIDLVVKSTGVSIYQTFLDILVEMSVA